MKTKLFLFTSSFPFESGETFLETEIIYLANNFDEVIVVSSSIDVQQTRILPHNCKVQKIDVRLSQLQRIFSILFVFNMLFWKELKVVHTIYKQKLTKGILSTMFISFSKAKKVEKYSKQLIEISKPEAKLYLYSYWCDDLAIGLSMAQKNNPTIKTFCRVHGWDVYFDRSEVGYLPFRHFIANNIKSIFSISEDALAYIANVWKVKSAENMILSRLGIAEQDKIEHIQNKLFTIVSCSNLIAVKRVDLLAEAIKLLDGKFPISWIHIGDGPERQKIESIISNLSTSIEIKLMGHLKNAEVFEIYKNVQPDVFINVSHSEGVPVSIMEAMSFGIAVIATNVGGNSEIVNKKNGLLLPHNIDEFSLAKHIYDFKNSPIKSISSKQNESFKTWLEKYNAELNYKEFVNQINQL
jgi:glycosyltransferase involved in cell wall biosynthesis